MVGNLQPFPVNANAGTPPPLVAVCTFIAERVGALNGGWTRGHKLEPDLIGGAMAANVAEICVVQAGLHRRAARFIESI